MSQNSHHGLTAGLNHDKHVRMWSFKLCDFFGACWAPIRADRYPQCCARSPLFLLFSFFFFSEGVRQEHLGDEAPSVPLKNETTQQSSRPSGFDLDAGKHIHTHTYTHLTMQLLRLCNSQRERNSTEGREGAQSVCLYMCAWTCASVAQLQQRDKIAASVTALLHNSCPTCSNAPPVQVVCARVCSCAIM